MATQQLSARPLEWNPPRQAISRVPHLPGLDGMRALAVVAVMIYHTNNGWLPGGFIGVEVFFVISGYLITLLLIGEHEKTGRIDLRQFWLRRARRLLPALFLMMALLMIYTAIFERDTLGKLRGDVLAGIGYITNWYQIWVGAGYTANLDFAPLRHLWSLAVEEQFYLFWPLIMVGLMHLGRRRLPEISRWLVVAALLIAVAMGLLYHPGSLGTAEVAPEAYWTVAGRDVSKMDTLYLSTITRATGLLFGAAFAMLWRPVAVMRGPLRNKGPALDLSAIGGLVGLGALAWFLHVQDGNHADPWLFRGGFIAVDLATLLVMAAVTHRGSNAGPVLGNPVLNWIGTRSYGLYLYHWPIYQIIRGTAGKQLTVNEFVAAMAVTVVITELSYRFVEMPIRRQQVGRWWDRIRDVRDAKPRQLIVAGGVGCVAIFGFAAVSMATAQLKQNEVAEGLGQVADGPSAGDLVTTTTPALAATTTPQAAPTTTVAGVTPPSAAPTTATTTTALAVSGAVYAFGDSVMEGARDTLTARGIQVYTRTGEQIYNVTPVVEDLAASGGLPESVVIHLGTNDEFRGSQLDDLMTALSGVDNVVVLTLHAPDVVYAAGNNEQIRALDERYDNVTVIDWDVLVNDCVGECLADIDQMHLSGDGVTMYVELIADAVGL
jgi:peptidoglycan/LPS O-acetylase OafA/YrhL